jgi:hypothetical protein
MPHDEPLPYSDFALADTDRAMSRGDRAAPVSHRTILDDEPPMEDGEVERLRAEIARIEAAQGAPRPRSLRHRLMRRLRRWLRGRRRFASR